MRDGAALKRFDYIVSNPPFKMDFSDFRDDLDTDASAARFFAGIPKVPGKAKDKMAVYLLFIQHIIASLKPGGKAAVVVPTGFITASSGIELRIRQKLVDEQWIAGVVSMPSNIFATTGTNVSILFIDKGAHEQVVLVDASALGTKVKEGKNQKTGSTPKSRTVVKGLRASDPAWRVFAASSGCGIARCIRTHQPWRHRVSDTSCGRPARA